MLEIIILVLLLLFIVGVTLYNFLNRKFIDKKNLIYFVPLVIVLFVLHLYAYINSGEEITVFSVFQCILYSIECFALKVDSTLMIPLVKNNIIFALDIYIAVILAGLTTFSSLLGLFKIGLFNGFNCFKKSLKPNLEIVTGDFLKATRYAKTSKNAILWIDSKKEKLSKEDKIKLFASKIPFIYRPLDGKRIKIYTFFNMNYVQIIYLKKSDDYLHEINSLIRSLDNKRKNGFRIHVEANNNALTYVDEKISEACQQVNNVAASSFDVYELISRRFNNEHNLAMYLPKDFLKNGELDENHNINVHIFGFGKTSKAIFKSLIVNNQFVSRNGDKYCAKKVNYHLYDKNKEKFSDPLLNYLIHYDQLMANRKNELKECELPCLIKTHCFDIKEGDESFLNVFKSDEKTFNFYFLSLDSDLENKMIAESLARLNLDNSVIFFNSDNEEKIDSNSKIIPYGFKNRILSSGYISNDKLWELSSLHNKKYNNFKNKDISLMDRPIIEKLSNAYSVINYQFKLNLLGLKYIKDDNAISLSEKEFYHIYDKDNLRLNNKYDNYFLLSIRNLIAYQEHLRWSIFYILNGYKILQLSEVYYDNDKGIVHKNIKDKKHACLVNYYELDKLIKKEYDLLPSNKKDMKTVDCYYYDFLALDEFYKTIIEAGYKIVPLF